MTASNLLLGRELIALIRRIENSREVPVVLCIGSDRLIGDSLGPIVGSMLTRTDPCPFPVYGTLDATVHALNIEMICEEIKKKHHGSPVIAIDASLGSPNRIGSISLRSGCLHPGAGVCKQLSAAGDISITGVTNTETLPPYLALQTARLQTVVSMAEKIASCVRLAGHSLCNLS